MIDRLIIENLGPIEKADVSLTPLTVLLGANASGKTSVLRAFELFASVRRQGLENIRFGGVQLASPQWTSIVHRGDETRALGFSAWVNAGAADADYSVRVGVNWAAIEAAPTSASAQMVPSILEDRLRDADSPGGWVEAGAKTYSLRTLTVQDGQRRESSIPVTLDALARHPALAKPLTELIDFARSFGSARYFKPVSDSLVIPGSDFGVSVWPAGEGFVGALAAWQNAHVEDFLKLQEALQEMFPHILRIRILRPDPAINRPSLEFETTRSKRLTPAALEADGVLTTLFLLWAAFTSEKDGLLLLDDPEAGLHPHLVGRRVEFLRLLAEGKVTGYPVRVVAATQSVEFARFLDLSEVRIVEHTAEHGSTVRSVPRDETLATLLDKYQRNVGELWYSGVIGGLPEPLR